MDRLKLRNQLGASGGRQPALRRLTGPGVEAGARRSHQQDGQNRRAVVERRVPAVGVAGVRQDAQARQFG